MEQEASKEEKASGQGLAAFVTDRFGELVDVGQRAMLPKELGERSEHENQGSDEDSEEDHRPSGGVDRDEEWRDVEPSAEGDPDVDLDPAGTLVGGTPVRMYPDAVIARTELARWLARHDFPNDRAGLVEAARGRFAPDAEIAELERLPEGQTFERIGDVVRALGYPTET